MVDDAESSPLPASSGYPVDDTATSTLPPMWLHGIHGAVTGGAARAIAPAALPRALLTRTLAGNRIPISLSAEGIKTEALDEIDAVVILVLFAEVAIEKEHTLLVAPKPTPCAPRELIWLIEVSGGRDGALMVLAALSRQGALRSDFQACFTMDGPVFGAGDVSTLFSARLASGATSLQMQLGSDALTRKFARKVYSAKAKIDAIANEVRILCRLQEHPNVLGFHGLFLEPSVVGAAFHPYAIVLDAYDGDDLHDAVMRDGLMGEARGLALMEDVFAALDRKSVV